MNYKNPALGASAAAVAVSAALTACSGSSTHIAASGPSAAHAATRSAPPATSRAAKPTSSANSGLSILSPGGTATETYQDSAGDPLSHYTWTLTKAENLGPDGSSNGYDVEALYATIKNTGTAVAEADLLTPMVWVGQNGQVDQTIGGMATLNNRTYSQTGTDLSLNNSLGPGQFETGYLNVDVPADKPGVIMIYNEDANGDPVLNGTLAINYDNLPVSSITAGASASTGQQPASPEQQSPPATVPSGQGSYCAPYAGRPVTDPSVPGVCIPHGKQPMS